jgi:hypothetical protein
MLEGIVLGFVGLCVFEFLILLALVVWERPFSAAFSLLAFVGLADFLFSVGIVSFFIANPVTLLGAGGAYIALGLAWSFPKWWFYVRKVRDEYLDNLEYFKEIMGLPADQPLSQVKALDFSSRYGKTRRPRASGNKERILTWMMYWPFSFIWTMIDEPLKRAFEVIFRKFRGVYERISETAFAGVEGFDEGN